MNTQERIERLEQAVCEIRKLLAWLAGDDTWQRVWEKLDAIADAIEAESKGAD